MAKIAIVTDSTAYIPKEMMNGHNIEIIPLQVIWEGKVYRDGIDITPKEFYTRLETAKYMPSTSQATPGDFIELYKSLLEQGFEILSVHISSKLSGTIDSAIQAKNALPGQRIELVDSLSTSMAMGFPVLNAAKAAEMGASLEECKTIVEKAYKNTGVLFVVSTLEFLHRGGRIGGAAAFIGNKLDMKPILELIDGKIEAVQRIRTMKKAIDKLVELTLERLDGHKTVQLACLHANAPDEAQDLLDKICKKVNVECIQDSVVTEVSPVIGTHTGPGTIGITYQIGM